MQHSLGAEKDAISSTLSQASQSYVAPARTLRPDTPPSDPADFKKPVDAAAMDVNSKPAYYGEEVHSPPQLKPAAKAAPEQFNTLTSSLFGDSSNTPSTATATAISTQLGAEEEDELRMPTRAVQVQRPKKETATPPIARSASAHSQEEAQPSERSIVSPESKRESLFDRVKGGLKGRLCRVLCSSHIVSALTLSMARNYWEEPLPIQ